MWRVIRTLYRDICNTALIVAVVLMSLVIYELKQDVDEQRQCVAAISAAQSATNRKINEVMKAK